MVSIESRYKPIQRRAQQMAKNRQKFELPLHFAIWNKMTSEVRCLVEGGANVDAQDDYGRTPLMMCCIENDEDWSTGIATMLLQAGANASLYDGNRRNALMFSLIFRRKRMTDLLLKSKDYDLHQKDKSRRTVVDYAEMSGEVSLIEASLRRSGLQLPTTRQMKATEYKSRLVNQHRPKSSPECTTIIRDTLTSAKVYAPSSQMNTHQFRRLVSGRFENAPAQKTASYRGTRKRLLQRTQMRTQSAGLQRSLPSRKTPLSRDCSPKSNSEKKKSRPKSASWKSIVPILWDTLSIQHCPSYRPPATPVPQTFEEALGLAPVEDNDTTISGDDSSCQDDNQKNIPPRRSSMPTSSNSSVHPSLKLRRRSEAIGMSSNSVTKFFFSEKKLSDTGYDQSTGTTPDFKPPQRTNAPGKFQSAIMSEQQRQVATFHAEDTADAAQKENIQVTDKPRSNSMPLKGNDQAHESAYRRSSFPRASPASKDSSTPGMGRRGTIGVIPNSQATSAITNNVVNDYSQNTETNEQIQSKTLQLNPNRRRRESILQETGLLPNISEEIETPLESTHDNTLNFSRRASSARPRTNNLVK